MTNPSNAVLLEKLNNLGVNFHDDLKDVKGHLKTLNGQVAKNTKHSSQQEIINKVLYAFGGVFMTVVTALIVGIF